jgi:hypothetical protein
MEFGRRCVFDQQRHPDNGAYCMLSRHGTSVGAVYWWETTLDLCAMAKTAPAILNCRHGKETNTARIAKVAEPSRTASATSPAS